MIWRAPVFHGDEITTTIKIVGLKENSNKQTGNVFVATTGRNQKGETVLEHALGDGQEARRHEGDEVPRRASDAEAAKAGRGRGSACVPGRAADHRADRRQVLLRGLRRRRSGSTTTTA